MTPSRVCLCPDREKRKRASRGCDTWNGRGRISFLELLSNPALQGLFNRSLLQLCPFLACAICCWFLVLLLLGEAMEQGLRDCCRSIRIGKILIQSDEETQRAKVYYAKFPPDIYRRKVLLMYPILSECLLRAVRLTWTGRTWN